MIIFYTTLSCVKIYLKQSAIDSKPYYLLRTSYNIPLKNMTSSFDSVNYVDIAGKAPEIWINKDTYWNAANFGHFWVIVLFGP